MDETSYVVVWEHVPHEKKFPKDWGTGQVKLDKIMSKADQEEITEKILAAVKKSDSKVFGVRVQIVTSAYRELSKEEVENYGAGISTDDRTGKPEAKA